MAANELTIKLAGLPQVKGRVDIEDFAFFCQAVAKCLKRAERIVTGADARIHYLISDLECASARLKMQAVRPTKGRPDDRRQVLAFFNTAVKSIQKGNPDSRLGPKDIEAFTELAVPVRRGLKASIGSTRITDSFVSTVDAITASEAIADGSVTGILDKLDLHNKTEIVIFPAAGAAQVVCEFAEELLAQIKDGLKRTVTVRGTLHYRPGKPFPYRVDAKSMHIHPRDIDLPTLHDVRAFGEWDTGGLSAIEFVRTIRNELA